MSDTPWYLKDPQTIDAAEFSDNAADVLEGLCERDGLLVANEALRKALLRNRQGYQNILEFRKLDSHTWGQRDGYGGRYGALTREEIEAVIAEIDTALAAKPEARDV